MGPRGDEQGRQPVQHVPAAPGRRRPPRRRPARSTARPTPTASGGRRPAGAGSCPAATDGDDRWLTGPPPLRGRRGRDRRIGEQVAADFAARHAAADGRRRVDFDVAAVDAEVEDARDAERDAAPPGRRARAAAPGRPRPRGRTGAGHRLPDLSALPPLLAATGSFDSLRERLGSAGDVDRPGCGRHVGLVAVPHGAKSYLAAALALAARTPRLDRPRRRDRRPRRRGARGVAGRPGRGRGRSSRGRPSPTSAASSSPTRRPPGSPRWRRGAAVGARILVASVQALLQHTIAPDDLPDAPRELRVGARVHQDALLHDLFDLGYAPVTEVAGRGEFARRGGIVDVFPPSLRAARSGSSSFGDEIDSLRASTRPTSATTGKVDAAVLLPASEFLLPDDGRGGHPRAPGPDRPARLRERLDADLARFEGRRRRPARGPRGRAGASRAVAVGDAAEVWAAHLAPATGPGPRRAGHAPGPRRAGRHRRGRGVPVAPGGRAPRRARRCRRAAQGLAVDLPAAARLEGPPRRARGRSS